MIASIHFKTQERLGALCVQDKLNIWLVQIPKTNEFSCKIQFFFQYLLLCGTRETIAMEPLYLSLIHTEKFHNELDLWPEEGYTVKRISMTV